MKTRPLSDTARSGILGLIVSVLLASISVFQADAQSARRIVAVYQFNSTIPNIPGPMTREMFINALVRSGKFAIAPQAQAGAEYIFDGVISEVSASKGKQKAITDLLLGEQMMLSFDVRIVDARTGVLVDYVNVTTKDVKSKKLNLIELLQGLNAQSQPSPTQSGGDLLGPYVTEAVNRLAAKYGAVQGMAQPGGIQPGYPYSSDPYQGGYPGGPGMPGFGQPVAPTTQYPSPDPHNPYGSSSPYGSSGYPPQSSQQLPQNAPGYPPPQYPPGVQGQSQPGYPQAQYPTAQPGAPPQYPATQPGMPVPGVPFPGQVPSGQVPTTQYPATQPGMPGAGMPFPGQAPYGQVQTRGIDDPSAAPAPTEFLSAKFDPSQHEAADVRASMGTQLREGSNLIHTDVSGLRLFATVDGGSIVGWSATDPQGNDVPLMLMGTESNCWACAMAPGMCWKIACLLPDETTDSTPR